tara:strand:- start:52 stop:354 length:303 start_codon:yes stop_codon:yes gene_type:complete
MSHNYLDWLSEFFDEAEVPFTDETAPAIDIALHRIAGFSFPQDDRNVVLSELRTSFLRLGPTGRQLLGAHLRDELFARRDGALRPKQGGGYYTNEEYLNQ